MLTKCLGSLQILLNWYCKTLRFSNANNIKTISVFSEPLGFHPKLHHLPPCHYMTNQKSRNVTLRALRARIITLIQIWADYYHNIMSFVWVSHLWNYCVSVRFEPSLFSMWTRMGWSWYISNYGIKLHILSTDNLYIKDDVMLYIQKYAAGLRLYSFSLMVILYVTVCFWRWNVDQFICSANCMQEFCLW